MRIPAWPLPYAALALLAVSIFLSIAYFDTNHAVPSYVSEQVTFLSGHPTHFEEPINVGSGSLVYATHRILPLNVWIIFKFWQLVALIIFACALYAITGSLPLTLLAFCYPPLLIDSYQAYTAFSLGLYALALLLFLKNKRTLAFLCAIPLNLISNEAFVFFAGLLLFDFLQTYAYRSIRRVIDFLFNNALNIAVLIAALAIYFLAQRAFYGSPFANFIYNQTHRAVFHFSLLGYLVRYGIFAVIAATSVVLYRKNRLLCILNTLFLIVYLYFAFFGYQYLFFAIQRFYAALIMYTIFAIGYLAQIDMPSLRNAA